jgi:hypothetical protein
MNNKTKQTQKHASGPCLCQGAGPALSDLLRRLGPPAEARGHFEAARLEFLKGLRALLDARIEQCAKPRAKGEKIRVE